jgi:Transposase
MVADELDYVVGVDTHRDEHVLAVVVAPAGAVVAQQTVSASRGYAQALRFAERYAAGARVWAVEGTGHYGVGLARYLNERGEAVLEVGRSSRNERRLRGKDDELDAVRAARALFASEPLALPRSGQRREALRLLLVARGSAVDVRREALVQLRSVIVTAPDRLRDELRGLPVQRLLDRCCRLRQARRRRPDPGLQRPNDAVPPQPRRRPATQPCPAHRRPPPPPTRRRDQGLHRATHRRRQEPPRGHPPTQALPRPPPLPRTTRPGAADGLTSHRSIIPACWPRRGRSFLLPDARPAPESLASLSESCLRR